MKKENEKLHVGIILDGNRRYAKKKIMKAWEGHNAGAKKLEKLIEWGKKLDIKELTLYTFSMQNFNRDKKEVNHLMKIFNEEFDRLLKREDIHTDKVRITVIGRIEMFPEELRNKMKKIMEETKNYDNYKLNFAMAYGGKEEIIDAVKRVCNKIKKEEIMIEDINQETFSKELYLNSCPDLIIRTSGEKRTSNFLPWQSTYSEWFFLDKMWPEFEEEDLTKVVKEFKEKRTRRFGK
jgi:tritrans,polycis-undecaprenyl-diphosphate synthase [geranylgeranyl-diphosphate specific]